MDSDSFRVVIAVLIAGFLIAVLVIFGDVMTTNPGIPWFISGIFTTLVTEVFIYGIYRLIKSVRERNQNVLKRVSINTSPNLLVKSSVKP